MNKRVEGTTKYEDAFAESRYLADGFSRRTNKQNERIFVFILAYLIIDMN